MVSSLVLGLLDELQIFWQFYLIELLGLAASLIYLRLLTGFCMLVFFANWWDHLLRCWDWLSLLNWIGVLTSSILLKLSPRKLEPWCVLWSFCLLSLHCISINKSYTHAWNTVVMSGLVLLVATRNCWISYKNDMQDCQSFTCYLSGTLRSSSKCSQFNSFL